MNVKGMLVCLVSQIYLINKPFHRFHSTQFRKYFSILCSQSHASLYREFSTNVITLEALFAGTPVQMFLAAG